MFGAYQIFFDCSVTGVLCPTKRGAVIHGVFDIETSVSFEKQPHHVRMTVNDGLVQRRGVAVKARRVEAVRIFAGIEQETDNFHMTVLGGQCKGAMAIFGVGSREQASDGG
jgi:hypothetical protein